jgi:hypothetical protein
LGAEIWRINAFNRDFAIGLKQELASSGRVYCAVPQPSEAETADAESHSVDIIPVSSEATTDEFNTRWIKEVSAWLKRNASNTRIDVWIGHDVSSGSAALHASRAIGGSPALVHHMSYVAYQGFKHNSSAADAKHHYQQKLFNEGAHLFGVGPLLQRACVDLTGQSVAQLVPGFPDIPQAQSPPSRTTSSKRSARQEF